jgi:hypothetical protein
MISVLDLKPNRHLIRPHQRLKRLTGVVVAHRLHLQLLRCFHRGISHMDAR